MSNDIFFKQYPELYHYTDGKGLEGILESGTLRATYFKDLNDTTEFQRAFEFVEQFFYETILPHIKEENSFFYQQLVKVLERHSPEVCAQENVQRIKKMTSQLFFGEAGSHLEDPVGSSFITSFCFHPQEAAYAWENGLLSQWRGYGGKNSTDGGFAIVFDTEELHKFYQCDSEKYERGYNFTGPAVYENQKKEIDVALATLKEAVKEMMNSFAMTNEWTLEKYIPLMFEAAAFVKHQAFEEEREVRHVVLARTAYAEKWQKKQDPNYSLMDQNKIRKIEKSKTSKNYIAIAIADENKPLPIKRIIIGPHRNQNGAEAMVKKLIGDKKIDIHKSLTPLS